ncbi:MAG: hypothetical protein ACOY94_06035 [Bacillota bacterium]
MWKELWDDFAHLMRRKGRSAADDIDVRGAAEHLLIGHFPEFTLSTVDLNRAVAHLMNLPIDACTWPADAAYRHVQQLFYRRSPFARSSCQSFNEVHLMDAAATGGLSEIDQELILWLSRPGGLTPAEIKIRFGWSHDQLAGWMAKVVTTLLSA